MKNRIEVRSQAELDACVDAGNIAVVIGCRVVARGNASVVAWSNVFVRLFSALRIKAALSVTILKHGSAVEIDGGRQLDAATEPRTGREYCEFHGLDPSTADYVVPDLDRKIYEQIKDDIARLDMGSWHGRECGPENWCNTTHCRAGFAICLAGEAGFRLEKKYGPELAGAMIYAVSRLDKEIPDFGCSNKEAFADIKASAGITDDATMLLTDRPTGDTNEQ